MTYSLQKSVVVSGASSFTGTWICKTFASHGWKVSGLCSKPADGYRGLTHERLKVLSTQLVDLHYGITVENGKMARWILDYPAQVWVHHHHWMENFRSPQYDVDKSNKIGIDPLRDLVRALKKVDYRGIVFSGSYFEPGEGGNLPTGLETPYSKSKKSVWENLLALAQEFEIPLSKVIIPDPIGPLENDDRLIPTLIRVVKGDQVFKLMNPNGFSDHVSVDALAEVYVSLARRLLEGQMLMARPSGWLGTTFEWIKVIDRELLTKINPNHSKIREILEMGQGKLGQSQSSGYTNRCGSYEILKINWTKFWKNYRQFVMTGQPWG